MTSIDCSKEMSKFHSEEVTLSNTNQSNMRKRRNSGRTRLDNGLDDIDKPKPYLYASQGSYMMRTMVQDPDRDYDIDDGAYFKWDDLLNGDDEPLGPLGARRRVARALRRDDRIAKPAIVKNNCIRQEYYEGYHIDIPVYRVTKDENEIETFELASGDDWVESDARAVTRWFNEIVSELNAGESDGSQQRRVVKLTKKFSKSRNSWKSKTTSGISITKLVVDEFVDSSDGDDISIRETWRNIQSRISANTEINHPTLSDVYLAENQDDEVLFFNECLKFALGILEVLEDQDCSHEQALDAWDEVFGTTFFSDQNKKSVEVVDNSVASRNDNGGMFG